MKRSLLTIFGFLLVSSTISAVAKGITYPVRQANGATQYYRLEVTPAITPGKLATDPAMPYSANARMSAGAAKIAAVAWAGGLNKEKGASGDLSTLGGEKPGGFYNASYIKVDSVQHETSPVPYYLVTMNGKIGDVRQTFYAAVLDDGRIVKPTAVSGPEAAGAEKPRRHTKHRGA